MLRKYAYRIPSNYPPANWFSIKNFENLINLNVPWLSRFLARTSRSLSENASLVDIYSTIALDIALDSKYANPPKTATSGLRANKGDLRKYGIMAKERQPGGEPGNRQRSRLEENCVMR